MANLNFLKKALPWIGTAIEIAAPGPLGVVGKLLTSVTGQTAPSKAGDLAEKLETMLADPATATQLKQLDQQFQESMQQMNIQSVEELEQIAAGDRASARAMQVQVRSWLPGTLAVTVTLGFFGLLVLMIVHPAPPASEKILDVMTGSLGTAWIMVMTYYFGSSGRFRSQDRDPGERKRQ